MIILHGDDQAGSREYLHQLIKAAKKSNQNISRFEAKKLDITILRQNLGSNNLFGSINLIIIYSLFNLPTSKNKNNLLQLIKEHQNSSLILWESKAINANSLKAFSKAQIKLFKIDPLIFKFVDQLKPNNQNILNIYQEVLATAPAEFIFAMLIRQIRFLIQAKSAPQELKLSPWQKTKFISQAKLFSLDQLLDFHEKLYLIDKNLKTGRNPLDLSTQIYNFLLYFT